MSGRNPADEENIHFRKCLESYRKSLYIPHKIILDKHELSF